MKWISAMFLAAMLMGTAAAPVALALQPSSAAPGLGGDNHRRKRDRLPEGSGGVIAVLTIGAVGGGLLVWRKKRAAAL